MSRKIDALIAEHVMGFTNFIMKCPKCELDVEGYYDVCHRCGFGKGDHIDLPKYSTDIKAAWEVVEKMRALGFCPEVCSGYEGGTWKCFLSGFNSDVPLADTAPMAICLAALKAKGIEIPNEL